MIYCPSGADGGGEGELGFGCKASVRSGCSEAGFVLSLGEDKVVENKSCL